MNRLGRTGGYMITASGALFVLVGAIATTGAPVGVGSADAGGVLVVLTLGMAALGSAAVGFGGPVPLVGRGLRAGLVTVSVGLASMTASAVIAASMSYDPLESAPVVVLMLVGGSAMLIGGVATVALLVRREGEARTVGRLFVAGLVLVIFAGLVANEVLPKASVDTRMLHDLMTIAAIAAAGVMTLAWAGLGFLVIRSSGAQGEPA